MIKIFETKKKGWKKCPDNILNGLYHCLSCLLECNFTGYNQDFEIISKLVIAFLIIDIPWYPQMFQNAMLIVNYSLISLVDRCWSQSPSMVNKYSDIMKTSKTLLMTSRNLKIIVIIYNYFAFRLQSEQKILLLIINVFDFFLFETW